MTNSVLLGAEESQQIPPQGSTINCSQSLASIQEDKSFSHLSQIFLFLRYLIIVNKFIKNPLRSILVSI